MFKYTRNIISLTLIVLFSSCEKNIDFDLKNAEDLLVVDAEIETAQYPTVVLSKSFDYFSSISPQLLANSFVRNADVRISNGTLTHQLREYPIPLSAGLVAYVYSIDTLNPATAFKGEFNKQYTLTISAGGKTYNAVTTIPALTKFPDSIWFKPTPFATDTTQRDLMVRTTDPPGLGNYIRYFTKRNNQPYLAGDNSVFDDQVIDGTTYTVQVDRGIDRTGLIKNDTNYFRKNDVVTLKLCNIDKATYTFWTTWEFSSQAIGNPFSQPGKVIGNISNGALGAFCGYAPWFKTVTVK